MKKSFFLMLLFASSTMWAQCEILGQRSVAVGGTATYSVSNAPAQCTNCYDWDIVGSNAAIVGSDDTATVQVTGISSGFYTLELTYFDETGCHTCSTTRNVFAPTPSLQITCIGLTDNGDGTVTTTISTNPALPSPPSGYIFEWVITSGGSTSTILGFPYVTVPRNCDNGGITFYALTIKDSAGNVLATSGNRWCDNLPACEEDWNRSSIYPNPVKDVLNVVNENVSSIEIYDLTGVKVKSVKAKDGKVDVSSLKKGNYLIKLYGKNSKELETSQIIKE